jgi:sulfonate transport system substrate-binding protein
MPASTSGTMSIWRGPPSGRSSTPCFWPTVSPSVAAWASDEANREAVFETWALSGVPAEIYRAEFEGQPVRYRNSPLIDGFIVNFYKQQVAASKQLGYIKRDVDVDRWIESKYLRRALGELKLDHYWDEYDADGSIHKAP